MQNGEYLRIIKKLIKCRDDDEINVVQQELNSFLDRNLVLGPSVKNRFSKRYIAGEASLHLHGFTAIKPSISDRAEFCAVINWADRCVPSSGCSDSFVYGQSCFGEVRVSVLVNVREICEESQVSTDSPTTVRLHSLDECKRLFGNPRQGVREAVIGRGFLGHIEPQREKTALLPVGGELDVSTIHLDEVERQVIHDGSQLIDNLSSKNGDLRGRFLSNAYLVCAMRLRGDSMRITASVSSNVLSYGFDMFRCPDEFELRGFNAIEHTQILSREFKG